MQIEKTLVLITIRYLALRTESLAADSYFMMRNCYSPNEYPRLIHCNESGTLRITADAPGRFMVISNSRIIYEGSPVECKEIYNVIINGGK